MWQSLYTMLVVALHKQLNDPWTIVGVLGTLTFGSRFIIQWIYSEKHGKSLIPICFWYISIVGSFLMLTYSIHKLDYVFIVSYMLPCLIYGRNLMLLKRKPQKEAA